MKSTSSTVSAALAALLEHGTTAAFATVRGTSLVGSGTAGDGGLQAHLNLDRGGYVSIVLHSVDRFEPLIVRYGIAEASLVNVASCCMTEIDCGGGLKCLTAEDPCPTGSGAAPWEIQSADGPFVSEVELAIALGQLADALVGGRRPTERWARRSIEQLRDRHAHRELLATYEPDGDGAWIDWILRLSTGAALHVRIATNPRRSAPVFRGDDVTAIGRDRTSTVSIVPTDRGLLVVHPRLFVD